MGFLGLFGLKQFNPELFDKELTEITQAVSKTRNQITGLKAKKGSINSRLISYSVLGYVAYVAYRYKAALNNLGVLAADKGRLGVFVAGQLSTHLLYLALAPAIVAAVVFLVDFLFLLWIKSKEKQLSSFTKKHREKIEELKRISNFNSTNELLMKYGSRNPNLRQNSATGEKVPQTSVGKNQKKEAQKQTPPTLNQPKPFPKTYNGPRQPPKPNASPVVPTQGLGHRGFLDRLLDYFIGSDHNESVETRYALICVNCYTHNGLAPPGSTDPMSITYLCRKCGYLNGNLQLRTPPDGVVPETQEVKPEIPEKTTAESGDKAAEPDQTPVDPDLAPSESSDTTPRTIAA